MKGLMLTLLAGILLNISFKHSIESVNSTAEDLAIWKGYQTPFLHPMLLYSRLDSCFL